MKGQSMLDKLPAVVRHYLIMLVTALLTWAGSAVTTLDVSPYVIPVLSSAISLAVLYWTPITRQYGVGQIE